MKEPEGTESEMRWKFLKLDCLFYLFSHYNSTQSSEEEAK